MDYDLLTEADLEQLQAAGIPPDEARIQIDFLKKGVKPVRLKKPCTIGDGIVEINEQEQIELATLHDEAAGAGRVMKFVPASGAASRMFSQWQSALTNNGLVETSMTGEFENNLRKLAFFQDLREAVSRGGEDIEVLLREARFDNILGYILKPQGLNYGSTPKALIKFHAYEDGNRTALEEHLAEAALYTADARKTCRIHFTVSEEHLEETEEFLKKIKDKYEKAFGVTFQIGLSTQHPSSQTVALEGKKLYRNQSGRLVLRPGGHGALLENLNDLGGDIIFIKNIDNVVSDRLKPITVFFKKVLSGCLLSLQEKIFGHLRTLIEKDELDDAVREAKIFCQNKLHIVLPPEFDTSSSSQQRNMIINRLNRPLRVCGMVKNEGEPGGGPFWIDGEEEQPLQIIEAHQIDTDKKDQRDAWAAACHFNPVDIVCGVRDYRARSFDLQQFADLSAVCLSEKIEAGRIIKILEHPGLWNGAMSRWNTVFVEVPIETFNPVKTVNDLLRPQHL